MLNVRDYGASGMAVCKETLELTGLQFKYLKYPPGITADIYYPRDDKAEYDSEGIQRAIDAAAESGGGVVYVPAGDYLIAPIRLRSGVELRLDNGARLWGSPYLKDYYTGSGDPVVSQLDLSAFNRDTDMPEDKLYRLITAVDAEDVSITGRGQINAQSPAWVFPWMNSNPTKKILDRPKDTIFFHRCRNVKVEDIGILNTPTWTLVFDECDQVYVRGVRIHTFDVINADGIDLHATSNATIADCNIWVMDDAICLKNVIPDRTMRNIVVTNCIIRTLCNGLKIGTDTQGNYENIAFSNIVIQNPEDDMRTGNGINLNAIDGGWVRNVSFNNIVMHNVTTPMFLLSSCRTSLQKKNREPRPGSMEDIQISNVQVHGFRQTSFITGYPGAPVRRVFLQNIQMRKTGDFYKEPIAGPVPVKPEQYPTGHMYGKNRQAGDQLPAYGLFCRHVETLRIRDFGLDCPEADARHFIALEQCQDVQAGQAEVWGPSPDKLVSEVHA